MEPAADIDFMAEAKFDAVPSKAGQRTGLLFQQDPNTWALFSLAFDGENLRRRGRRSRARPRPGTSTARRSIHDTIWLRAHRDGDEWTLLTSSSGKRWTEVGAFDFRCGSTPPPFAGNFGTAPPPTRPRSTTSSRARRRSAPRTSPTTCRSSDLAVDEDGPGNGRDDPRRQGLRRRQRGAPHRGPRAERLLHGLEGRRRRQEEPDRRRASKTTPRSPPRSRPTTRRPRWARCRWSRHLVRPVVKFRTSDDRHLQREGRHDHGVRRRGLRVAATCRATDAVTVTGLEAGKTYNLQASGTDRAGHVTDVPNITFTTLSGGGPSIDRVERHEPDVRQAGPLADVGQHRRQRRRPRRRVDDDLLASTGARNARSRSAPTVAACRTRATSTPTSRSTTWPSAPTRSRLMATDRAWVARPA